MEGISRQPFDAGEDTPSEEFYAELRALDEKVSRANEPADPRQQQIRAVIKLAEQTWRLYHPENVEHFKTQHPRLAAALSAFDEHIHRLNTAETVNDFEISALFLEMNLIQEHWKEAAKDDEALREHAAAFLRDLTKEVSTRYQSLHYPNLSSFPPEQAARITELHNWRLSSAVPTVAELEHITQVWEEFKMNLDNPGLGATLVE